MKNDMKRGFTLVELMIVIAVIAIISAIAAPNFTTYMAQRRLNGAARMVMSDLMAARQKAVTQNNQFRVIFSGNQYTILDDDDNDGTVDGGETTEVRNVQTDYHDVTISSVSANPIFYPRGTASGCTVTLASSGTGSNKYVKVALNGRVIIDDSP